MIHELLEYEIKLMIKKYLEVFIMKKRCDILINGLSVGHVYYYYFEFDSLQVNLLDFDKSVICFL